jgi:hypothetical protein
MRVWTYAWASPTSLLGLSLGLLVWGTGGRMRREAGVLEFSGGLLARAWARWPAELGLGFGAITLGHVIVGLSATELDRLRRHERVHVRQCERWGPLFVPAYLLSSAWQLVRGRRPYLDNHFEREAHASDAHHTGR